MEENVALDSKKQKKFVKSIRGIKKLMKKNEGKPVPQKKDEKVEPQKPFSMRLNNGKINKKKKRIERGLVYLSHIPHGFYEHQMTQYFKQFGVVTNARVIKSKRTGNSKGCAFVEFKEPAVGQIVAETMNNYLMGKRLIKAAYIPPEKQKHKAFRKHWNSVNNPSSQARLKLKKIFNTDKDEAGDLKKARKLLSNLSKTKKKLSGLGINYDFFAPVDVPEVLQNQLIKQEKDVDNVKEETSQVKKNVKKGKPSQPDDKANGKKKEKPTQVGNVKAPKANNNKLVVVNAKEQKDKNLTLKKAGVKPADEFIKIEDDDSDSSYAFDSDEYEKMLQDEINYDLSADESDSDDDDEDDDSEDQNESKEESPVKPIKEKLALQIVASVRTIKHAPKQEPPKLQVMQQKKQKLQAKRKGDQKPAVTSKKPKFEKQNQKPIKKSFKKK